MKRVVREIVQSVPAGATHNIADIRDGMYQTYTLRGPGEVRTQIIEYTERRTATKQRRARWAQTRSFAGGCRTYTSYGRRATDAADNEERRWRAEGTREGRFELGKPMRRKGDERRVNGMYRRRPGKGGIRFGRRGTDPLRFPPIAPRWGRRTGDTDFHRPERRSIHYANFKYGSSNDPRIRALERRKS